ncbi:GNAT family N-acetyltransferase [Granulicella sp. S190]|uniref:GNAT family N-acetyltransferase n=1 Tax=Granulicella sp. S190 TaxID=1747226 RepID=UPI00131B7F32|nr:GNAT family N-acetyltransferase [Granulicella sp. S190]
MKRAEFHIRPGSIGDIEEVMRLERATTEAPHWTDAEYLAIVDPGSDGAAKRCLFLAERDRGLLGFAVGNTLISGAVKLAELESVVVNTSVRRGGLGRALCQAVIAWCKQQGAAEMELEVRAGSAGVIAFYLGLGFLAVGKRAGYYRDPVEDALLMQLKLAGDE